MSGSGGAFRFPFQLAYQVSPIILSGGIAASIAGFALPIVALTEALTLAGGLFTGSVPDSLNDFFAQFLVMPGGTMIANAVGQYPFASQIIAGNAIIEQPLSISIRMIAPVRQAAGYLTKLPLFSALRGALQQHNRAGGTYYVVTPAGIWDSCIMIGMTDITGGNTKQTQAEWQIDFQKPLISLGAAQSFLNGFMSKMFGQTKLTSGASSGPEVAVGQPLQGAAAPTGIIGNIAQYLSPMIGP